MRPAGPKLTGSLDIDPYCFVFAKSRGAHEAVDTIDASFCFADWCTVSRRNRADLKTESNLWRAGGSVIWTDPDCCCGADAASEGCAVPRSWGASDPSEPTESPLELAQIRYFVTLCRERNFTRAARRCGVSQPSLSNGIKALECELGGKLFERSDMSLTPLGKSLRLHFESAVASVGADHKAREGFPSATVSPASRRGGPKSTAAGPRSSFERSAVFRRGDAKTIVWVSRPSRTRRRRFFTEDFLGRRTRERERKC